MLFSNGAVQCMRPTPLFCCSLLTARSLRMPVPSTSSRSCCCQGQRLVHPGLGLQVTAQHQPVARCRIKGIPCQHAMAVMAASCQRGRTTSVVASKAAQPGEARCPYDKPDGSLPTAVKSLSAFISSLAAALSLSTVLLVAPIAQARPRLTPEEQLTISIFKKNQNAVVNITNNTRRRDAFTMTMLESAQGAGSGFIWDGTGHIVTNFHVITDASDIKVTLSGGTEYGAKVVGVDLEKDIAVLQINVPSTAKGLDAQLHPLNKCSSSADLVVGQKVYAIGNPFGLDHTLTTGVVSGTGREILSASGRPIQDVVQTDAAINPGNSGGPLLDSGGCLIGINTAIYSPSGVNSGVGFAIPIDMVKMSVAQILQHGKVVRPMLGIAFAPDQSSQPLGIHGIMVLSAKEGGPAWKAGLQGTSRDEFGRLILGDIITQVNGKTVKSSSDLYRVLDKSKIGDTVQLSVLRHDATHKVAIKLESDDPPSM